MRSFREFLTAFEGEIRSLFFEMVRRRDLVGEEEAKPGEKYAIPVWDEYDQRFYKYIVEHAPERVRNNPDALRRLIQQAMFWRYGNATSKGKPKGILHEPGVEDMPETVDRTFNVGGVGKFTIKDIPMHVRQMIAKINRRRADWHNPDFGYSLGNWGPYASRAQAIVDDLLNGKPLPDEQTRYNPADHLYLDAPESAKKKRQERVMRGSKKKEVGEYEEKSTEPIPLDDEDRKFIDDFINELEEQVGAGAGPLHKSGAADKLQDLVPYALGIRYSDHYVTKDKDGNFIPRTEYTSKDEPEGFMYAPINIPFGFRAHLARVYMNIPHLVRKFERYRKSRDFAERPLISPRQPSGVAVGKTTASRWLQRGTYAAQHATKFGTTLRDQAFYDQIAADHDLWRAGGGVPVQGEPIEDRQLAAKCKWRDGDMIVESPNIQNAHIRYNPDEMPWEDVIRKDAETGVRRIIQIIGQNAPAFREFAMQPDIFEEAVQIGWVALAMRKTGIDPEKYRSERERINMAGNAARVWLNEKIAQAKHGEQGRGVGKDDEDQGAADRASASGEEETGNIRTGLAHHGNGPEGSGPPMVTSIEGDPDELEPADRDDLDTDAGPMWQAPTTAPRVPAQPQVRVPMRVPPGIGMSQADWLNLSRDQRIEAMQKHGLL